MTGSSRLQGAIGVSLLGLALAACSSTTYGTGVSPGMQTLNDLTGIASTPERQDAIAYQPRPELVTPPATATLPTPGGGVTTELASNWPVDPDQLAVQVSADAAAREAAGIDPVFALPPGGSGDPYADLTDKEREELAIELYKQARSGVAVDENGNPVRRYLTDPPTTYMVGDTTVPIAVIPDEGGKGWKWPWQWFSG
jgi:hypothetical protein